VITLFTPHTMTYLCSSSSSSSTARGEHGGRRAADEHRRRRCAHRRARARRHHVAGQIAGDAARRAGQTLHDAIEFNLYACGEV
jgi:hypothetical protein